MQVNYAQILTLRYPGKIWQMSDVAYETLDWLDESPKPSKEELDDHWDEVNKEIQAEIKAREQAKESAVQKLAQLGLTPSEVQSILQ